MIHAAPKRILLATDLSCRCDRALDRAVQLAGVWKAELVAATIVEPNPADLLDPSTSAGRRPDTASDRMRRRLARDVAGAADAIRVVVATGDPATELAEIARREQCDLIVTGIARDETLGRMFLGNTVNRLVRAGTTPVLVVRDRPRHAYRRIVVATDFSEAALQATLAAAAFFPEAALTLFHGYDIPYQGYLAGGDFTRETRALAAGERAKLAADERIAPALRGRIAIVVEHGAPEVLIGRYVEDHHIDLTVIGSVGRGVLFDALIGSMDKRLHDALDGDLLIVRQREGEGAA